MKFKYLATTLALAIAVTAVVAANEIDSYYQSCSMFGINRATGQLKKFNFATNELTTIGTVKDAQNHTMLGIDASAYIPGHNNIIAFHKGSDEAETRMVYINTQTGKATPVGSALGLGSVTGAVASTNGTASVAGLINLNPNNSPNNEFTMITTNGVPYTRDNLHQNSQIDEHGVFYEGDVHFTKFKPKGNGNQNGMSVNGSTYTLDNGNLYSLVGTMNVKLYNDSVNGNGKAMGKWWLQIHSGTCFVLENGNMQEGGSTGKAPMSIYALQDFTAPDLDTGDTGGTDDTVDFDIVGDKVVATEDFALKVTVIGAAISAGGSYDIPVTTKFNVGGQISEPFGSYSLAVTGNVNDDQNPRSHTFDGLFDANSSVTTIGRSWLKKRSSKSGSSNNHWKTYMSVSSESSNSQQLMVLRDGDDVPDIPGFENQNSIEDFLGDYIADGKIKLTANQAIFLFELGTTNINSSAADFQDLCVLVTLGKTVESLSEPGGGSESEEPGEPGEGGTEPSPVVSRLIKVNHLTGGYSQLMTLERKYDSLATADSLNFYATVGNKLYKIDTAAQTETEMGTMSSDEMFGLEFAGTTLMGFQNVSDMLTPMNDANGSGLGTAASLGMTDLGTIIFMPNASDPSTKPVSYD